MDCVELSDLEEGEILENDSCPSVSSERCEHFCKTWRMGEGGEVRGKLLNSSDYDGDNLAKEVEKNSKCKEENNLGKKCEDNVNNCELDDILSSDEDAKYTMKSNVVSRDHKSKGRKGLNYVAYGTVEDIMSQIGQTISRKSKCNYKKRKSRDFRYSNDLNNQKKINLTDEESYKFFSSHYSSKLKRKKRDSDADIDSFEKFYNEDVSKECRSLKRKKKKKKDLFSSNRNEERIFSNSSKKVVDFDEMRKNLLEKLKKQKAEEELKSAKEAENSEIQEVEMIIECTNYVDKPTENGDSKRGKEEGSENSSNEEEEEEEELDLMKLRSVALASKEKRKIVECSLEIVPSSNEKSCSASESNEHNRGENNDDDELDRNELLLRAEALKTALLKKHQRRLSKIRKEKGNSGENSEAKPNTSPVSPNDFLDNGCDQVRENAHTENETDETSQGLDCSLDKENINKEAQLNEEESEENKASEEHNNIDASSLNQNTKKCGLKQKAKKKKRKSFSLENHAKEKEKNEATEEDDRTLRFQLLSDLLKKKSLKNCDKKCVLTDSIQTSTNAPAEGNSNEEATPKAAVLQSQFVKKAREKKSRSRKPVAVPKPEIERIIVHLKAEESSDEDPDLSSPPNKPAKEIHETSTNDESSVANYEKNVDLLLSRARRKIEEEMKKTHEFILTPEAVYKHLPPSQRLEYIRLKQKLAERESLKKGKKENQSNPMMESCNTSVVLPPKATNANQMLSPNNIFSTSIVCSDKSPSKIGLVKNNCGNPVSTGKKLTLPSKVFNSNKTPEHRKTLNSLVFNNGLSVSNKHDLQSKKYVAPPKTKNTQQNYLLTSSNQAIIAKLKLLLRKIKLEKTIEENYEKEIVKLKTQMSIFEKKKSEQQFKIKKLAEESMKIYKLLQPSKAEKPSPGPQKKEQIQAGPEPKKEVEQAETQENSKPHIIESGRGEEKSRAPGEATGNELVEYNSPLQVFNKVSEEHHRVDPNIIMCQFDLTGVCKDEECSYQHFGRK